MAKKELTYKDALQRAEEIVQEIERGDIDIDEIAKNLEEARKLLTYCKEKIYKVDTEIKKILEEDTPN